MILYQLTKYNTSVQQIRPLSSDFREFSVQKRPLLPIFRDMRMLTLKTPFSANFRTYSVAGTGINSQRDMVLKLIKDGLLRYKPKLAISFSEYCEPLT